MKTAKEEQEDLEAEAKFWQEWDGKTDCFGTVAKVVLLALIFVQSVWF